MPSRYFTKIFIVILRALHAMCLRSQIRKSPYSVGMQENTEQKNPEYKHFLRSASDRKSV